LRKNCMVCTMRLRARTAVMPTPTRKRVLSRPTCRIRPRALVGHRAETLLQTVEDGHRIRLPTRYEQVRDTWMCWCVCQRRHGVIVCVVAECCVCETEVPFTHGSNSADAIHQLEMCRYAWKHCLLRGGSSAKCTCRWYQPSSTVPEAHKGSGTVTVSRTVWSLY
jgi:hypothetical protein